MTPFQEELYRLIQDCKLESNAFTSSQEDAGNEITRLMKFSTSWDFKDKYEAAKKENEELQAKLAAERASVEAKTIKNITQELIPIIDDLFLLLEVSSENLAIKKTVRLLLSNCEAFLRRHEGGIIKPKIGEALNPVKHKAVAVVETNVGVGTIIEEVFRVGYFVKNQVLREAEVKVRCVVAQKT